jgi:hypothetical protein
MMIGMTLTALILLGEVEGNHPETPTMISTLMEQATTGIMIEEEHISKETPRGSQNCNERPDVGSF